MGSEEVNPHLLTDFRSETPETLCHAGLFAARPTQAYSRYVKEDELRKARQGAVYRTSQ